MNSTICEIISVLNLHTLGLIIILALALYVWIQHCHKYWQRLGVPYLKPLPFVGNLKDLLLLRISFGDLFWKLHVQGSQLKTAIVGMYVLHKPAVLLLDPQLIQKVTIKDFHLFLNRYEAADAHFDDFGALSLPLAKYHIWRESRKTMSEVFTTGQIRYRMFPIMQNVAKHLQHYIDKHFDNMHNNDAIIEVQEMSSLFTTDLTTLQLFDIDSQGLQNGDSAMRTQVRRLFDAGFKRALHFFTIFFLPEHTQIIRAKVFSNSYSRFMRQQVENLVKIQPLANEPKNDNLIQRLRRLQIQHHNNPAHFVHHKDFIPSQMGIFLLAGFETSSSVISFMLYELAKQTDVQNRLRAEILQHSKNGREQLSYEQLKSMKYLNMCVTEGLRLYPAATFINREYTPNNNSLKRYSLRPFADYEVPKGMPVYISILGLQRDAKVFLLNYINRANLVN